MNDVVENINKILPQTQCELCGYRGCRPYAEAIVYQSEQIDRCVPGGVEVLVKLGELVGKNPAVYLSAVKEREVPERRAVIDEAVCIGCKKCIIACPVDAILGASKLMHAVISDECTGCGLCVDPCPVDCIDMVEVSPPPLLAIEKQKKALHYRERYEFRNIRLEREKMEQAKKYRALKFQEMDSQEEKVNARMAEILEAVERVKERKNKDLSHKR